MGCHTELVDGIRVSTLVVNFHYPHLRNPQFWGLDGDIYCWAEVFVNNHAEFCSINEVGKPCERQGKQKKTPFPKIILKGAHVSWLSCLCDQGECKQ